MPPALWRTRAALLDRVTTAARRVVDDRGLTIRVYRVPGGYEARELAAGAPACSNELIATYRPPARPAAKTAQRAPIPAAPMAAAGPGDHVPEVHQALPEAAATSPAAPQTAEIPAAEATARPAMADPAETPAAAPVLEVPATAPPVAIAPPIAADKPSTRPAPSPKKVK